jgi:hypothetical protein
MGLVVHDVQLWLLPYRVATYARMIGPLAWKQKCALLIVE